MCDAGQQASSCLAMCLLQFIRRARVEERGAEIVGVAVGAGASDDRDVERHRAKVNKAQGRMMSGFLLSITALFQNSASAPGAAWLEHFFPAYASAGENMWSARLQATPPCRPVTRAFLPPSEPLLHYAPSGVKCKSCSTERMLSIFRMQTTFPCLFTRCALTCSVSGAGV